MALTVNKKHVERHINISDAGLDPAGPKFDKYGDEARLTKSAAKFVDVIHTDGGGVAAYYGLLTPAGHMDFYPNAGRNQPGCWTDIEPGVEFHGNYRILRVYND